MTGHSTREDHDRFRAAGMDDHVAKPVVAEQLFSTLHDWLSGQRATLKGSRRAPPATP